MTRPSLIPMGLGLVFGSQHREAFTPCQLRRSLFQTLNILQGHLFKGKYSTKKGSAF